MSVRRPGWSGCAAADGAGGVPYSRGYPERLACPEEERRVVHARMHIPWGTSRVQAAACMVAWLRRL